MTLVKQRRQTRQIRIKNISIGSDHKILVQSMTNTFTEDIEATISQIVKLEKTGCEIIRVAVPNLNAAQAIKKIKKRINIPIIADIHFDYRLAIASIKSKADGLRINPGNIEKQNIKTIVNCAKDYNIPIRIGVNTGSLEKDIKKELGVGAKAMVKSALRNIEMFEDMDFHEIKVSIKSSDVLSTIEAYRLLAKKTDLPFHVGITEAGGLYSGITKSAIGIGILLAEGIGDTIRVSLTRDSVEEIRIGYEILRALNIRQRGPELISCPTCGRCKIDLFTIAQKTEKALLTNTSNIKVAIMGCAVNGPGEAKQADIGIAGGESKGILFKKGKVIKQIDQDKLVDQLLFEIGKMTKQLDEKAIT